MTNIPLKNRDRPVLKDNSKSPSVGRGTKLTSKQTDSNIETPSAADSARIKPIYGGQRNSTGILLEKSTIFLKETQLRME